MATIAKLQIVLAAFAKCNRPALCAICQQVVESAETGDLRLVKGSKPLTNELVHKTGACPRTSRFSTSGRSGGATASMPGWGYLKPTVVAAKPYKACGAAHPHAWNERAQPCNVNVHGLADGKHGGAHGCFHAAGINDRWNDAGQVWDSDPIEIAPAAERGTPCRDAWGPSGLAFCLNPRCPDCRGGR